MFRIFFTSLGCDKNLVDSEVMLALIAHGGFELVYDETQADIAVINTCSFIQDAVTESVEHIISLGALKKRGLKYLVVTGCLAQRYRDDIFNELPEVDAVIGTGDYDKILEIITELTDKHGKISAVSDICAADESLAENRMLTGLTHVAYLKIAEGCDNNCTYCTIPKIRGRYRSRSTESLLREARNLSGLGVRELVIIAQDTANYGIDLYGESRLHILLNKLSEIDGIEWIRLMYAYPEHITDALITEMTRNAKICHYIDMPIQHSSDKIIRNMGRRGSNAELRALITKLREHMPDICIRTTLIVGFPGETRADFAELMDFAKDMRFDRLGVFEYSREEGTPAANLPGQKSLATKKRRKDTIMRLQRDITRAKNHAEIGKKLKIITDGKIDGAYCGRSYRDAYEIDGLVFFNADHEIMSGEFIEVTIKSATDYDLYATRDYSALSKVFAPRKMSE